MSAEPDRGYLGISEVLAELRAEFPDIRVSKIRFLETEGLIEPARSPSGYRRFRPADVARLRYILTAQRDQYLPLRVIKERLDSADRPTGLRGRRELLDEAGISDAQLTELESFGLLRRVGRQYTADAVEVARAAAELAAYGIEARHLGSVRTAAEREITLVERMVSPLLAQRSAGARELAWGTAREIAVLMLRLHQALLATSLAEAGLAGDGGSWPRAEESAPPAASLPAGRPAGSGQRSRGIEGATA
jgi:DNA-binding transcriptional MerR regulator